MSLADVLITIFIFVIILGSILGIYFTYRNIYSIQVSYNELSANSTIAMQNITTNIREGLNVMESKNINGTDYATDYDTLILKLASIDNNQDIINDTYDYLVYYRDPADSTLLKYDIEPDPASVRQGGSYLESEYIDTLVFNYNHTTYSSIDKVETIIKTEKTINKNTQDIIIQTTTDLRNN